MLTLTNILGIDEKDFINYKIHFAFGANNDPLNEYLLGRFKEYQEYQTKPNFNRKYIISLVNYDRDIWMYAGIYEVLCDPTLDVSSNLYIYQTNLLDIQSDLIGRLFFTYKKDFRASYPRLELMPASENKPADMVVYKIDANKLSIEDFPGFDKIKISYDILNSIINQDIPTWKNALSKAKGIYLIADTLTGKLYVGSAYGESAIWQRWSEYSKNGHGGNKDLRVLLKINGDDYKKNFQYSVLEINNLNTSDIYIFERETHWKEILLTRKHGLNSN